jgi:hypothetical protein
MDLGAKIEGYISGLDIINNYKDYKAIIGNDLYNRCLTSTLAIGRIIFDSSLIISVDSLANGDEKTASVYALAGGIVFILDRALNLSRNHVISYKLNKQLHNSL